MLLRFFFFVLLLALFVALIIIYFYPYLRDRWKRYVLKIVNTEEDMDKRIVKEEKEREDLLRKDIEAFKKKKSKRRKR